MLSVLRFCRSAGTARAAVLPMLLRYAVRYCKGRLSFPITLFIAAAVDFGVVDACDVVYSCYCSAGVIVVATVFIAIIEVFVVLGMAFNASRSQW